MLEEFQEPDDVISPEQGFGHKKKGGGAQACRCSQSTPTKPIDIPAISKVRHSSILDSGRDEELDDDEGAGGGVDQRKILLPHELVLISTGRSRNEEKIACSVCFGIGRTLKGRDLQCFRNSVLRMTGFLES